jgi:hypothetical protein
MPSGGRKRPANRMSSSKYRRHRSCPSIQPEDNQGPEVFGSVQGTMRLPPGKRDRPRQGTGPDLPLKTGLHQAFHDLRQRAFMPSIVSIPVLPISSLLIFARRSRCGPRPETHARHTRRFHRQNGPRCRCCGIHHRAVLPLSTKFRALNPCRVSPPHPSASGFTSGPMASA